jgi:hypothetical protein
MWAGLRLIELKPGLKILLTGSGRVSGGVIETLGVANVVQVDPDDFLNREFDVPVFSQIGPQHYTRHRAGGPFNFNHFVKFPHEYESTFLPYAKVADILMTGHFWDPRSPVFFTKDDMKSPDFRISIIADISCDIDGGIPSTIRSTTISDPFYAYNPFLEVEEPAFSRLTNVTVMSIDNLPGELPRDASLDFGKQLMSNVLHDLLTETESPMITRASIMKNGKLTDRYSYLNDYLYGDSGTH